MGYVLENGRVCATEKLYRALTQKKMLLFDGSMGAVALKKKLTAAGVFVDSLYFSNPEGIKAIHKSYVDAGSDVITIATFNSSPAHVASMGIEIPDETSGSPVIT